MPRVVMETAGSLSLFLSVIFFSPFSVYLLSFVYIADVLELCQHHPLIDCYRQEPKIGVVTLTSSTVRNAHRPVVNVMVF
jgi:hypothetical protein